MYTSFNFLVCSVLVIMAMSMLQTKAVNNIFAKYRITIAYQNMFLLSLMRL